MPQRKLQTSILLLCLAILLAFSTGSALAEGEEEPTMSAEAMAEMEAWMKLAQPGEHHEHLARFVGKWNSTVKMWMDPEAEPMVNTAKAEARSIMGGRYIQWNHSGIYGGMPFEGMAIEGYDNGSQQYQGTWIDNFGTLNLLFEGQCSDDGMKRETSTSFGNPMAEGDITMRTTIEWTDKDHFTYLSFMDYGGGEKMNMEIQYERASE